MSTATSIWTLAGDEGHLQHGATRLVVNAASPDAGILFAREGSERPPLSPLSVSLPRHAWREAKPLVDLYTRGDDLIATYAETPLHPLRVQIYWRSLQHTSGAVGAEVLLSMQTGLLDADPTLQVATALRAGDQLQPLSGDGTKIDAQAAVTESGCFVTRATNGVATYVEMIHPHDAHQTTVAMDGERQCVQRRVFEHRLEKGVILRARLRGLLLPDGQTRVGDTSLAAECFREFAHSEPPLTT